MAYKIKDLMIHLPTGSRFIPIADNKCSGCIRTDIFSPQSDMCPDALLTRVTIWQLFTPVMMPLAGDSQEASLRALSTLKEQLQRQLSEVEREQAVVEKSMTPQTVEEVDMLTARLNEALKELKVRRAELAKKPRVARSK